MLRLSEPCSSIDTNIRKHCGDIKWWGFPRTHTAPSPQPTPGPYQLFLHQCCPVDLRVHLLSRQVVDLLVFPAEVGHTLLQLADAEWGERPPWLVGTACPPLTPASGFLPSVPEGQNDRGLGSRQTLKLSSCPLSFILPSSINTSPGLAVYPKLGEVWEETGRSTALWRPWSSRGHRCGVGHDRGQHREPRGTERPSPLLRGAGEMSWVSIYPPWSSGENHEHGKLAGHQTVGKCPPKPGGQTSR